MKSLIWSGHWPSHSRWHFSSWLFWWFIFVIWPITGKVMFFPISWGNTVSDMFCLFWWCGGVVVWWCDGVVVLGGGMVWCGMMSGVVVSFVLYQDLSICCPLSISISDNWYVVRQVSIYGSLFDLWRTESFLCAVDENDQFFFSLVHSLMEEKKVSWHSQR